MTEARVQAQIMQHIERDLNGYVVKIITCNRNGFPDIHFLIPSPQGGYAIPCYCEVKREGKEARPLQVFRIKELNNAGGVAFQADSLTKFKEEIDGITRQPV